ncbi:hypothetical protein [Streptomyces sp. NPDC059271]|uniref:hypothetical protein n=1 Tax=Streptomyces sp. NPDC059271 TaxID=3346799 RepID=UPI0036B8C514
MNNSLLDQLHSVVASPAFIHVAAALAPVVTVVTALGGVVKVLWRVARLLRPGTGKHRR